MVVLASYVAVTGALGCGHPATKEECEEIFNRSAELALKEKDVLDRAEVDKQVANARVAKGEPLIKECLGKRITVDTMSCVRSAGSPQELDACLD